MEVWKDPFRLPKKDSWTKPWNQLPSLSPRHSSKKFESKQGKKPGINLEPESEGRNKAVIPWLEEEGFSKLCFAINVANTVAHLPQVTCMAYGTEHQAGVPALPLIAATPWESHLIALSSNSFMWNVIIGALFSS